MPFLVLANTLSWALEDFFENEFVVACYATLYVTVSVGRSVGRSFIAPGGGKSASAMTPASSPKDAAC